LSCQNYFNKNLILNAFRLLYIIILKMTDFWKASNKIPVQQTSVRLPSTNGLNYSAGQEIRLSIPEDITYFNPSGNLP
tara:strand:- start:703 stop:936 length:234 start_codon:yes stop_codon:yes gene_type:complete